MNDTPPDLNFIKAWTLRIGDLVWEPWREQFLPVRRIDTDLAVGVMRVEFEGDWANWYSSADVVQIPRNRARAREWNEQKRLRSAEAQGATPMTDS